MRIAIVGEGKMGRAVRAAAEARGHRIATVVTGAENPAGRALTAERLAGVEVAIEFTRPDAVLENLDRLCRLGIPVVTGTTGWSARLEEARAMVEEHGGALLYAANFSIGIQLLYRAAAELARALRGRPEFEAHVLERHHREKRDAPSGTALALLERLRAADPDRDWPVTAIRAGWVPGTHALELEGRFESLTLQHTVRDRAVFAEGALLAAEWLPGRRGVYTFEDILSGGAA